MVESGFEHYHKGLMHGLQGWGNRRLPAPRRRGHHRQGAAHRAPGPSPRPAGGCAPARAWRWPTSYLRVRRKMTSAQTDQEPVYNEGFGRRDVALVPPDAIAVK